MTSGLVILDGSQGDEGQDLKHFIGDTSFKVLVPLLLQGSHDWKALGKGLPTTLPAWFPVENTTARERQGRFYSSYRAPRVSAGARGCAVVLQPGLFLLRASPGVQCIFAKREASIPLCSPRKTP